MIVEATFGKLLAYYGIYAVAIFFASLSIPTGAIIFIISYGANSNSLTELLFLIILAFICATIGDMYAYALGYKFRPTIEKIFQKVNPNYKHDEEDAKSVFAKYREFALFFSRFLAHALGPILNYICGYKKVTFERFLFASAMGELFYAGIYSILGYMFREELHKVIGTVRNFSIVVITFIALIIILGFLSRIYYITKNDKKQVKT